MLREWQTRDTCALCAVVSRAMSKPMSWRTSPSGFSTRYVPRTDPQAVASQTRQVPAWQVMAGDGRGRQGGLRMGCGWHGAARVSGRTDSGGAVVSRCPAGHRFNSSPRHRSAKRAGVGGKKIFKQTWCPVEDTDLPPRMARNVPTSEIRGSKHFHTRIVF